jgi:glycosyltransferase involved in cell wall biosynthesis
VPTARADVICFSHLRWDDVFQRPHHLMSLAARDRRVFFVEEPSDGRPGLELAVRGDVTVVTPHVPSTHTGRGRVATLTALVDELVRAERMERPVRWHYSPAMLPWSRQVPVRAVAYDAMDELSAFAEADPDLPLRERQLFAEADVVFTGGRSLYEAKRSHHWNVHPFPSAVDIAHFARARTVERDPVDQAGIPHPRLGWFGVIDERMDLPLLEAIAARRPDWSIVLVGPVAKLDPAALPDRPNLHLLGQRPYDALPDYLGGWDVAIMPFARNEATRFISPTKTPEYLAGGRPVVSTSIRDVVDPYGERGLVRIADDPAAFVAACEGAMAEDPTERQAKADAFLEGRCWESTWAAMDALVEAAAQRRAEGERAVHATTRAAPPAGPLPAMTRGSAGQPALGAVAGVGRGPRRR